MSTSYRRLQVEVTGSVGGFSAAMNQVLAGTRRVGSGFRSSNRDANLFNKQLLAIGTTARYALAGQLVFGITAALSSLASFKAELGTIDSLAGRIDKQGNFHSIGNQLDDVGSQAVLMSNKLGIAVSDVEQYMQRFFSSFSPAGGDQARLRAMTAFVDRVGMLQAQMGSEAGDPQQLAGGIAGLIHNIPGGTKNISGNTARIGNLISFLTAKTPNITGRDIARDIGRIGATQSIARMTPEQAFAVWGVAGMSGGSSSVIGRGIAQLLGSSLLHPTTPKQRAAYSAAGLPTDPTTLRQIGGFEVLSRMLQYASPRVGKQARGRRGILNSEEVDDSTALAGMNLTAVYNMLGRQESVRQFVNLLGQGGVKALKDYIKHQQQAIKVDQQRQRYQAAAAQRTLTRFGEARRNISMNLVAGAAPAIEFGLARPTIWASNFTARHRTTTQGLVLGGLGLGALSALSRLGGGTGLLSRVGRGQRRAVGGAITAEELPAILAGGAADGTRGNPFWVIISPATNLVNPDASGSPLTDKTGRKWPNLLPLGGRFAAGGTGLAFGAAMVGTHYASQLLPKGYQFDPSLGKIPDNLRNIAHDPLKAFFGIDTNRNAGLSAVESVGRGDPRMRGYQDELKITGTAYATIDVNTRHPDGSTSKTTKRGVPVKLWNAKQYPTAKGKPGSRTGAGK